MLFPRWNARWALARKTSIARTPPVVVADTTKSKDVFDVNENIAKVRKALSSTHLVWNDELVSDLFDAALEENRKETLAIERAHKPKVVSPDPDISAVILGDLESALQDIKVLRSDLAVTFIERAITKLTPFPRCAKTCKVIDMLGASECESACPKKFSTPKTILNARYGIFGVDVGKGKDRTVTLRGHMSEDNVIVVDSYTIDGYDISPGIRWTGPNGGII
jgi:hypothetical protein